MSNTCEIKDPNAWRVSKSGYSIMTGWDINDSRCVAQYPSAHDVKVDAKRYEQWLEDAERICEMHNAALKDATSPTQSGEVGPLNPRVMVDAAMAERFMDAYLGPEAKPIHRDIFRPGLRAALAIAFGGMPSEACLRRRQRRRKHMPRSSGIVSDKRRQQARKHAKRSITCRCGKVCKGNGGISSHMRACKEKAAP